MDSQDGGALPALAHPPRVDRRVGEGRRPRTGQRRVHRCASRRRTLRPTPAAPRSATRAATPRRPQRKCGRRRTTPTTRARRSDRTTTRPGCAATTATARAPPTSSSVVSTALAATPTTQRSCGRRRGRTQRRAAMEAVLGHWLGWDARKSPEQVAHDLAVLAGQDLAAEGAARSESAAAARQGDTLRSGLPRGGRVRTRRRGLPRMRQHSRRVRCLPRLTVLPPRRAQQKVRGQVRQHRRMRPQAQGTTTTLLSCIP